MNRPTEHVGWPFVSDRSRPEHAWSDEPQPCSFCGGARATRFTGPGGVIRWMCPKHARAWLDETFDPWSEPISPSTPLGIEDEAPEPCVSCGALPTLPAAHRELSYCAKCHPSTRRVKREGPK